MWSQENLEAMSIPELQALRNIAGEIIEEKRTKQKEKAILNFKTAIDNLIKEYPGFIDRIDIIEIIKEHVHVEEEDENEWEDEEDDI